MPAPSTTPGGAAGRPGGPPVLGLGGSRTLRRAVAALAALTTGLVAWWFVTSAPELPTADGHVSVTTTTQRPVYVGLWSVPADFGRTLQVTGVHLRADATTAVEMEALLCRGGSVGVTSDPEPFCRRLDDPAGSSMGAGDSLVVRVVGDDPGAVYLDRPTVAFREGPRWGTREAGTRAVIALVRP